MSSIRVYSEFAEVEKEIANNAPTNVYKYRKWSDLNHKRILTDREIWFAHPFTLNDPTDFRRPYKIDITGYNTAKMFAKLVEHGRYSEPELNPAQLQTQIAIKWNEIQQNPLNYFRDNMEQFHADENIYSRIGLFSTCRNELNIDMWKSEEYSENHKGFVVGFNTVELTRETRAKINPVIYTDEHLVVNVVEGFTESHSQYESMLKYRKWEYEDEFRFSTYDIKENKRAKEFSNNAITEIILGKDCTKHSIIEICATCISNFPNVPIYKTVEIKTGVLSKELIR